ncbi:hypothetical protein ACJ5NV_12580 [Loktanella agnita]|uniref:hypothetical protein n=1 Tax=Loktanella agnita TaxID=287097 RepID=UPI003987E520
MDNSTKPITAKIASQTQRRTKAAIRSNRRGFLFAGFFLRAAVRFAGFFFAGRFRGAVCSAMRHISHATKHTVKPDKRGRQSVAQHKLIFGEFSLTRDTIVLDCQKMRPDRGFGQI